MEMESDKNQLKAWFFNLTVPALTIFFVLAAALVYKTFHQVTFDSGVLIMCAFINLLAIISKLFCL
jgi:hypothetical protein